MAIEEKDLRRYITAGIVRQVVVRKAGEGWELVIHLDNEQLVLERQRGGPREFRSLDRLASWVEALGITEFVTQVGNEKS